MKGRKPGFWTRHDAKRRLEAMDMKRLVSLATASFRLNGDGTLTWTDYKGTPGDNEVVFEKAIPVADYSGVE